MVWYAMDEQHSNLISPALTGVTTPGSAVGGGGALRPQSGGSVSTHFGVTPTTSGANGAMNNGGGGASGNDASTNGARGGGAAVGLAPAHSTLPQRRPYLYVGQLSRQVNDVILKEVFSSVGPVLSTKVVIDRNMQNANNTNYGFVEYADVRSAETALQTLNGRKLYDAEIKVDWAASSLNHGDGQEGPGGLTGIMGKENTAHHFHIFVGDLAPEVNDSMLRQAFQPFTSLSEARVMWDVTTGKSRGYGFVAFRERADAEQAIATMNGEWLGSRTIRVNWANQKGGAGAGPTGAMLGTGLPAGLMMPGGGQQGLMPPVNRSANVASALGGMGFLGLGTTSMPPTAGAASGTPITYEQALAGSAPHNTTVYVGNLPPFASQNDLIPLFSQYGYIIEVRMQSDRGFAFVKLDSHENAANAIVNLAGQIACGRPIKCGWGKDRNESAMLNALRQNMQLGGYGALAPPGGMGFGVPQYGFPTGGFGFGQAGVPGQAGQPPMDAASLQQLQAAQLQALQAAQVQVLQQQQHQSQPQLLGQPGSGLPSSNGGLQGIIGQPPSMASLPMQGSQPPQHHVQQQQQPPLSSQGMSSYSPSQQQ